MRVASLRSAHCLTNALVNWRSASHTRLLTSAIEHQTLIHMTSVDLRLDARWVVPITPFGALPDHAVMIDNGRIVAVRSAEHAAREYIARETVSLPPHERLSTLVNA